jgi:2-isopropylmalate synthase
MPDHVKIFDTTLRDGEQSPGISLDVGEKLEIADQLARLGVDVIEAGFPIASQGDFEAVEAISKAVHGPIIAGLSRTAFKDVDRAWEAVRHADKPRIHIFIATSPIHMKKKLRMTEDQVREETAGSVARASGYCRDVEFSPEDGSRSDADFLVDVCQLAVDNGATTLNIPDTVGYGVPEEYAELIRYVIERVRGEFVVSTHCHNDLGLAVANSLAAARAGARQVECTINGIGERAGNAALEEFVMALHTRGQFFGLHTTIETRALASTSRLVSQCTGIDVPPNKAIVGANAFAHEAGIHQDGVLKNRLTYEIMSAETVGWDGVGLVLGKHSGRHALRVKTEALGYELTDDELSSVFARFKELADRKKLVDERDIHALMVHHPSDAPKVVRELS